MAATLSPRERDRSFLGTLPRAERISLSLGERVVRQLTDRVRGLFPTVAVSSLRRAVTVKPPALPEDN
jgi:hypothetical protein